MSFLREIISQSDRPSDMHRRIELCRQALASLTRDRDPPLWAALQLALGKSPRQDPRDERADNLERAIEHLGAALTVYTREAFPELWAITQNNLGLAYAERIRGERVDNLERAIKHYHQALTIREGFPEPWDRRLRHLSKRRQENAGRTCRITSNRPGCSPASR